MITILVLVAVVALLAWLAYGALDAIEGDRKFARWQKSEEARLGGWENFTSQIK